MRRATVHLKLHLDLPGFDVHNLGWLEMRAFIDAYTRGLKAMPGGPAPARVLPLRVTEGTITFDTRLERVALPAAYLFQEGPTDEWTPAMRREAEPLYDYLRKRNATLGCAVRGAPRPFVLPQPTAPWTVFEWCSAKGQVFRVGGEKTQVEIRFEDLGTITCSADETIAKAAGTLLYKDVVAHGRLGRDSQTGAVLSYDIDSIDAAPTVLPRSLDQVLDELHAELAPAMTGFDLQAFLRESRG